MKYIRILSVASTALLFSACSTHHGMGGESSSMQDATIASSACSGNQFLQKFGCSVTRITAAARGGDADAQYALGYMYYYGIGTPRDESTAVMWIDKSAAQGQPLALRAKRMIAQGSSFHHGGGYYSDEGGGRATGGGGGSGSLHQPKEDVSQLSAEKPTKPIADVLPAYKNKDKNVKRAPVLDSLKRQESTQTAPAQSAPNDNAPESDGDEPTSLGPNNNHWSSAETWMMHQPKQKYSLQLMGGFELSAIKRFVKQNHLQKETRYYSANLHGKKWYMLVYGDFDSAKAAINASDALPKNLRSHHPWVKSFVTIQKEIQERKILS